MAYITISLVGLGHDFRMISATNYPRSQRYHFLYSIFFIVPFLTSLSTHAFSTGESQPCTYDFELQTSTMRISCPGAPASVNIYTETATLLTHEFSKLTPSSTSKPRSRKGQTDFSKTSASESESKSESERRTSSPSKLEHKADWLELYQDEKDSSFAASHVWNASRRDEKDSSFASHVWNASRRLDETRRSLTGYSSSLENVSEKLAEGRLALDNDMEKLKQTSKTPEELKQSIVEAMTNQFTFTRTLLLTRNQALQDLLGSLNTLVDVISESMQHTLYTHRITLNRVDTLNETLLSVRSLMTSELRKKDRLRGRLGKQGKKSRSKGTCPKEISAIGAGTYVDMKTATGTYMTQAGNSDLYGPVYVMRGPNPQNEVEVYETPQDVIFGVAARYIPLPYHCSGTGHVVYRRHLYCHQQGTNLISKFHLKRYKIIGDLLLPGAGYSNTFPYTSGQNTDVDLAVDELGLWAIYATNASAGKVVISKINHKTMELVNTWMTSYPKRSLGNAFMVCGTLYATDSHKDVPTFIRYVFNTETGDDELLQPGEVAFLNSALIGRPDVFAHAQRREMVPENGKNKIGKSAHHKERKPTLRERLNGRRFRREARESTRKNIMTLGESNSVMLSYDFRMSLLFSWNDGRLESFPVYFREEKH